MAKYDTYTAFRQAIEAGDITCQAQTQYYLQHIEASSSTNAYIEVFADEALARAQALDQLPATQRGPLHGMVISLKDMICYKDHIVTGASNILSGFQSLFSATAVQRVLDAGAIIIGRTNCDEFGMGSANEFSAYGPTLNGEHPEHIPGGSSGGAAVSVQMDTCLLALGTDTGGSVRQPAAFCGIYGMKPTYGRISRYGLLAYASSLDQLGLLARHPEPIALALEIIAGVDEYDATTSDVAIPEYSNIMKETKRWRIAYWPAALQHPDLHPEVRQTTEDIIQQMVSQGHSVEAIDFEWLDYSAPTYYVLATAEASSNLARYDGIRYGHRADGVHTLEEVYTKSRSQGFGAEVQRRILLGTFVLSAGYYDAYYAKAQKVRRLIYESLQTTFKQYDIVLLPVSPGPPRRHDERNENPTKDYLADIFTVTANLAGLPAISVPVGNFSSGLPLGIQLMSAPHQEGSLLRLAAEIHQLTR